MNKYPSRVEIRKMVKFLTDSLAVASDGLRENSPGKEPAHRAAVRGYLFLDKL